MPLALFPAPASAPSKETVARADAPAGAPEGVAIAADVLRAVRAIPGVAGVHLMTFGWVDGVERVLRSAD
jgi:hypothetical protein